jgi:hypothetical protein
MYRSCIFCSADLGSNDSLERFPVGRSLAFDGEKGRLWAVCGRCARWNLAPIEERWEAVEDAERLFRNTRVRVQNENVGLARVPDGTRLVRVGPALPGELAVWRYGGLLRSRRAGYVVGVGIGLAVPAAAVGFLVTGSLAAVLGLVTVAQVVSLAGAWPPRMQSRSLLPYTGVAVDAHDLRKARFAFTFWGEVSVELPHDDEDDAPLVHGGWRDGWLTPSAGHARTVLRRGFVELNATGARGERVRAAVALLAESGSAEEFLRRAAAERAPLVDDSLDRPVRAARMLAAEMAVHDDLERAALHGELAALEAAWQQAEEIAAIADALPDLPPPEAPRLFEEG